MTKRDLEALLREEQQKNEELEKANALLRDTLQKIANCSEDDLPERELEEAKGHGWDVYPLLTGYMRAIADCALDWLV